MIDPDLMTTLTRLALVLGGLFLAAAVGLTFAPSSANGSDCGTWVAPAWSDDGMSSLRDEVSGLQGTIMEGRAAAILAGARASQAACTDELDTRRSLALAGLGLAVVAPGALVWIGRGRDRTPVTT